MLHFIQHDANGINTTFYGDLICECHAERSEVKQGAFLTSQGDPGRLPSSGFKAAATPSAMRWEPASLG